MPPHPRLVRLVKLVLCLGIIIHPIGTGEDVCMDSTLQDLPELQQLTMEITFTRGGKPLFTSVGWLGFVGTFTAISRQGYSVSLNFRKGGGSHVPHLLKTIFAKKAISTFTVRDLLVSFSAASVGNCLQACHHIHTERARGLA